jgi:NOP5NT (NUC127) domain
MLILFETPAGFALFQVNQKKISKVENLYDYLEDETVAKKT